MKLIDIPEAAQQALTSYLNASMRRTLPDAVFAELESALGTADFTARLEDLVLGLRNDLRVLDFEVLGPLRRA